MFSGMIGKRLIFAVVGIIICSVVTVLMKYDAQSYLEIVKWITLGFIGAQTITDVLNKNNNGGAK